MLSGNTLAVSQIVSRNLSKDRFALFRPSRKLISFRRPDHGKVLFIETIDEEMVMMMMMMMMMVMMMVLVDDNEF